MADLPNQTDPPVCVDGEWSDLASLTFLMPTRGLYDDLCETINSQTSYLATAIGSLRARLAQAEAEIESSAADYNELANRYAIRGTDCERFKAEIAERGRIMNASLTRALKAEAALATARRDALLEAADELQRKDSRWVDSEPLVDGPVSRWLRARAALVVADTGEGLSKTSAKPLVVADTPEQEKR